MFNILNEKSQLNEGFMTSSFFSVHNEKISDRFNPQNDSSFKIYDFGPETVVVGLKEIRIKSCEEFFNLMK